MADDATGDSVSDWLVVVKKEIEEEQNITVEGIDMGQIGPSDGRVGVKQKAHLSNSRTSGSKKGQNISFEEIKTGVENLMAFLNDQLGQDEAPAIVDALQKALDSPPTLRVGFLGNTGAGKTTLLNRLLGYDLLPAGDFSTTTASNTEIIGTEADNYFVIVNFIGLEEWKTVVANAKEELVSCRPCTEDEEEGDNVKELHLNLNALWDMNSRDEGSLTRGAIEHGFDWETKEPLELVPKRFHSMLMERSLQEEFSDIRNLRDFLINFTHRVEGAAWPLVRKISILGPFRLLYENGFTLVDIPGDGDDDLSMGKRNREGRALCDCLFYLYSAFPRPCTKKMIEECTNKTNLLYEHFGVIMSNAHHLFKKHPAQAQEDAIKQEFLAKMKKFRCFAWQEEQFEKLNFYFLENGDEARKYQRYFDNFVEKLKELAKQKNSNGLERCIQDISLALDVGLKAQLNNEEDELQVSFGKCRAALAALMEEAKTEFAKLDVATLENEVQPIAHGLHYRRLQRWLRDPTIDVPGKVGREEIILELLDINKMDDLKLAIKKYVGKSLGVLQQGINANKSLSSILEKKFYKSYKMKNNPRLDEEEDKDYIREKLIAVKESRELESLIATGKGCQKKMLLSLKKWYTKERAEFKRLLDLQVQERALEHLKEELLLLETIFGAELTKNQRKVLKKEQIFGSNAGVNPELFRQWAQKDFFEMKDQKQEDQLELKAKRRKVQKIDESDSWKELLKKVQAQKSLLSPEKVPAAFNARNPIRGRVTLLKGKGKWSTRFSFGFDTERKKGLRTRSSDSNLRLNVKKHYWMTNNCFAFNQLMQKIFKKLNVRREYYEGPLELFVEIGDAVSKVVQEAYGGYTSTAY